MMIRALVGVLVSLGLAMTAGAQVADHLQCLNIKDALPKTSYTATLTPTDPTFPAAPGCVIKIPAKMLCVDVTKTNVVGTPPPGPVVGAPTDKFLCYKVKCPKESPSAKVTDQFGTHQVTVTGTGLLCAPAPTPTTLPTTTTTTTLPCAQDSDCSPPANQCQAAICSKGVCGTQNVGQGAKCNENGGSYCDGNGTCVQCVSPGDCPLDTCFQYQCDGGTCVVAIDAPPGTACNTSGGTVCDGSGNCVQCVSPSDCPQFSNQCEQVTCYSGICYASAVTEGASCNQNGGTVCDIFGDCVQCNIPADCPPTGNECIDAICDQQSVCGTAFVPAGFPCFQGGTTCDGMGHCS